MTDKPFADAFVMFQLSSRPNVLIVTLIGHAVAGRCRRARCNFCDVYSGRHTGLLCQPLDGALEPIALAGRSWVLLA
jgi:hypothetical protein